MVAIGHLVKPGCPAPVRGTYICAHPGCTGSFVASMAGTPLPPAHHPKAQWRLMEIGKGGSPSRGGDANPLDASRPDAVPAAPAPPRGPAGPPRPAEAAPPRHPSPPASRPAGRS
jgi:hypothetical protein